MWILLGELEEIIWRRGTRQHPPGRSFDSTRHPLHQGQSCTGCGGHKAEWWHEAHLSFVWESSFTLALCHCCTAARCTPLIPHVTRFSILPHHRVCPDLDQPANHSLTPLLALDLSCITVVKSLQLACSLLSIIFARPAQAAFPLVWTSRTHLFSMTRGITEQDPEKSSCSGSCLASRLVCAPDKS